MSNLDRLKNEITDLYRVHGEKNGYSPATISHMINEIDFFALYQCLRHSTNGHNVAHYIASTDNGPAYSSSLIFPEEVLELCHVVDYDGEDNNCRMRHSIVLVVREDMSLAVLTCCETVIGDFEYWSAYHEIKEKWPCEVAHIDLEKLHKRLTAMCAGYDERYSIFFEP